MDFAEDQLKKHGWKSGDGLGKKGSGIKEAIKVKMKVDNTGVGHDAGKEFSFHWWDHVFNKAASNIHVQESQDGVEVKNTGDTKVSKNKTKSYADKSMLYGQFVKGATLSGGSESKDPDMDSNCSDEELLTDHCLLPDNEEKVFKLCGGRTAHKGARHGLKLNGKLQRLEEQEKLLLQQHNASVTSSLQQQAPNIDDSSTHVPRSKSKKKKKRKHNETEVIGEHDVADNTADEQVKRKKLKKSKKNHDCDILNANEQLSNSSIGCGNAIGQETSTLEGNRITCKSEDQSLEVTSESLESCNKVSKSKKKKKRKDKKQVDV